MRWLEYNPRYCINCLCCMTVKNKDNIHCRNLIDSYRHGGPKFGDEKCASSDCTECVDICPGKALYKE